MCKRNDNTDRSSEFICLRCLKKNQVGDKIRRPNMREKDHVKNLCCLCTKLQMRTKNLEVGGAMILMNEWNMQRGLNQNIMIRIMNCYLNGKQRICIYHSN